MVRLASSVILSSDLSPAIDASLSTAVETEAALTLHAWADLSRATLFLHCLSQELYLFSMVHHAHTSLCFKIAFQSPNS